MLDADSPLLVRPRADLGFLRWSLRFARSCRRGAHRSGTAATLALAREIVAGLGLTARLALALALVAAYVPLAGAGPSIQRAGAMGAAALVAALAAVVLLAILYTVATREPKEPRGYAEFTMFPGGCAVAIGQRLNVSHCAKVADGVYAVAFTKSIAGSTPIATRGSCCPGPIGASVGRDQTVVVALARPIRRPVRASVLVP